MPSTWRSVETIRVAGAAIVALALGSSALAFDGSEPPAPPANLYMIWDASGDAAGSQQYDPNLYTSYAPDAGSHPFHNAGAATAWGTWNLSGPAGDRERTGWRYRGGFHGIGDAWEVSWDCVVNQDPFVDATINVTNNSVNTETFWIYMPLSIVPTGPSPLMSGSVAAALSSQSLLTPAQLATNGVDPIYQAYANPTFPQDPGAVERTLLNPGYTLNAAPGNSASDSAAFINEAGPAVIVTDIAILLRFTLTAGDSASVTGIFEVVVPGPGGLAVFALVAALGGRRRRQG